MVRGDDGIYAEGAEAASGMSAHMPLRLGGLPPGGTTR